jgi:hypothetical protein
MFGLLLRGTLGVYPKEVRAYNRSVMPLDGLGCTCATMIEPASETVLRRGWEISKLNRDRDRSLQLWIVNEEFLVRTSHHLVLITSLPFVHTARRFNRLDDPANYMDLYRCWHSVSLCEGKRRKPYHLEDEEVVTRYP